MFENQSDSSRTQVPRLAVQQERQRAQRMSTLDAIAGGIADNLSDLFHAAEGSLRMSQEDLPSEHIVQDYLDQAFERLGEAEDLVHRLLAFSRMDGAGERKQMDLAPLVQEVLSLATFAFPRALTLRTRFDGGCVVTGSRPRLQQLVAELVTTAGQSMEGQWHERPTVLDVSVQRVIATAPLAEQYLHLEPGPYAHLAVSATGIRTGSETADAEGSLSVARHIAEAHEGTLTVRRERGEGTTFNVYLPIATENDSPTSDLSDPPAAERNGHVLVVDDDETVRTLESTRLPHLGYDVTQKADGHRALTAVEQAPAAFDVALVDHHMPDMNGLELAHAFRECGCEAPVVLMTGLPAQASEAKARVVGIDRLLRKPVERHELSEVLAQLG